MLDKVFCFFYYIIDDNKVKQLYYYGVKIVYLHKIIK